MKSTALFLSYLGKKTPTSKRSVGGGSMSQINFKKEANDYY